MRENLEKPGRALVQRAICGVVMAAILVVLAPVTFAQDAAQLRRDVVSANDFRVRVSSALALGKRKDVPSVGALSQALKDDNGAVRAAAAAALGAIGDPSALSALTTARDKEKDASVKQSIEKAISTLNAAKRTRVIVSLSKLENKTGDAKIGKTFQSVVKSELARLPGIEVSASESEAVEQAKQRKLPTLALDARLTQLTKSTAGADVAVAAKVELLIRKIPEQSLKATVKGDAKALASSKSVKGESELAELREDAVKAAVASAVKGAPTAFEAATK
ncbi:MAG: HEAT repeat domain-containing protein [Polyangiaceae bacterium]|nr:HEAT repeat domain-containing protein [Polyangiaceae bacterium]